jgi:hypothetical protein
VSRRPVSGKWSESEHGTAERRGVGTNATEGKPTSAYQHSEDPRLRLALDDAWRAIDVQRDQLGEIKSRTIALLSVATIAIGLLGERALFDAGQATRRGFVTLAAFCILLLTAVSKLDAIVRILDERIRQHTNRAVAEPPSYVTRALGERPRGGGEERAWVRAVAAIETYRVEHDITDRRSALRTGTGRPAGVARLAPDDRHTISPPPGQLPRGRLPGPSL